MRKGSKTTPTSSQMCSCGHPYAAHEHYRRGTECAICDVRTCSAFTAVAANAYTPTS